MRSTGSGSKVFSKNAGCQFCFTHASGSIGEIAHCLLLRVRSRSKPAAGNRMRNEGFLYLASVFDFSDRLVRYETRGAELPAHSFDELVRRRYDMLEPVLDAQSLPLV